MNTNGAGNVYCDGDGRGANCAHNVNFVVGKDSVDREDGAKLV